MSTPRSRTARSYAAFVRRRLVPLVVCVLIGVGVAAVLLVRVPTSYVAATRVVLTAYEAAPTSENARPRLISPDSDAAVLASVPVLDRAADRTGYPGGAEALAERLAVGAVSNSRILVVRVPDEDPDRAVATAEAVVEEFLALRGAAAQTRADSSRASLEVAIAAVSERLADIRNVADGGLGSTERQAEEERLADQLSALQRAVARSITTAQDPGFVVTPAAIIDPAGPPAGLAVLATGALLGVVVGLGAAALLDQRRRQPRRYAQAHLMTRRT